MNPETRLLIDNLNRAEDALRANLHTHFLDETARGHMERATNHVREAFIAVNEPGTCPGGLPIVGRHSSWGAVYRGVILTR